MALSFEIRLTINQIACLRAIDRIERTGVFSSSDVPDWWKGTRFLLSEKLIFHIRGGEPNERERSQGYKEANRWGVTEKGRHLLRVVELDIMDAAEAIGKIAASTGEDFEVIEKGGE